MQLWVKVWITLQLPVMCQLLCERHCYNHGTNVQVSQVLFLDKKSCELLFTREDNRISSGEFQIWKVQSASNSQNAMLSRNGWSVRIFKLAVISFPAFKMQISCENYANWVDFTHDISKSVKSLVDRWSFIQSFQLTRQLATNLNINDHGNSIFGSKGTDH